MSQKEVLIDLLDWVREKHPERYFSYLRSIDKKKEALDLLRLRLRWDQGYIYILPEILLRKLGLKVDNFPSDDSRIMSMIKMLNMRFCRAFHYDTCCGKKLNSIEEK